ncbi:myelin-associated glycoprotein-like [Danio aesculapii]|uniref:myelin-associated glycoprotein-like n=1 Tax=Danio aesculapii TaxID=1142201 RepID=UPI0024C02CBF|nr:myelin-associated glycoprotein-like [Danio aesculapii]
MMGKQNCPSNLCVSSPETAEQPSVSVEDELTSGEQVSATCAVSHSCPSDLPQVTWSHQGSHSGPSQPQDHGQWKLTSYSLTFTPSREDHNTRLNCTADFKGKTVTGYKTLTVKYPPYNVKVVTGPPVKENESVTLTCSSDSNPPATSYEWFSLNKTLVAKGSSYQLMKVSRHTEAISCTAINTEGRNSSKPHQINVLYPPFNVKVVTGPPVKENDSVTLTCSSDSNPPATNYEWFSLNKSLLAKGSSYQLVKVFRDTEAISCTAINTEGRNSSDPQKLDILYPPDIKNESSCQSVSSTVCVCIVDSNPPSEVKWFGPNFSKTFLSSRTEIKESLSIFTLKGWLGFPDTVQCVATNSVGSSSITLKTTQNGETSHPGFYNTMSQVVCHYESTL